MVEKTRAQSLYDLANKLDIEAIIIKDKSQGKLTILAPKYNDLEGIQLLNRLYNGLFMKHLAKMRVKWSREIQEKWAINEVP